MGDRRQQRKAQMQQRTPKAADAPKSQIRNVCVYCGSTSASIRPSRRRPEASGSDCQDNDGLVYGGGSLGLMGELARTVLPVVGT